MREFNILSYDRNALWMLAILRLHIDKKQNKAKCIYLVNLNLVATNTFE